MKVASVQIARTVSKVRTIDRRTLNRHPRFLTSARVNSVSTRFIRTPLTCIVTIFLIGRRAENINNSYKKKKTNFATVWSISPGGCYITIVLPLVRRRMERINLTAERRSLSRCFSAKFIARCIRAVNNAIECVLSLETFIFSIVP